MKSKFLTLVVLTLILVSCGTQKTSPVASTTQSAEPKKDVVLTSELMEGQILYSNNCAKCHKLYEPKKFSQEEWAPILVRMQKKAHLDDTQIASVSNYINSQL
ncbi:cytochrome c [Flavobacterium sp.]|uniref:cytochrome c n=1 Tax=Flavobacterium sp. TaxID=239 RepID=UPI003263C032